MHTPNRSKVTILTMVLLSLDILGIYQAGNMVVRYLHFSWAVLSSAWPAPTLSTVFAASRAVTRASIASSSTVVASARLAGNSYVVRCPSFSSAYLVSARLVTLSSATFTSRRRSWLLAIAGLSPGRRQSWHMPRQLWLRRPVPANSGYVYSELHLQQLCRPFWLLAGLEQGATKEIYSRRKTLVMMTAAETKPLLYCYSSKD
jgi:hypothetical protein